MKLATLDGGKEQGTRYELCAQLQRIGIDAQMVEGAQAKRDADFICQSFRFRHYYDWYESVLDPSSGFIEIRGSPIRWATTLTEIDPTISAGEFGGAGGRYSCMVYVVPDVGHRFSNKGYVEIWSVRTRSVPFIGPFRLRWVGNDEVMSRLNVDELLRQEMIKANVSVRIRRYDVDWAILGSYSALYRSQPSRQEWYCYETIASHLSEISR